MKYNLTAILLLATAVLCAQTSLTIEGQTYVNSEATWSGVNIPRSVPTSLTFKNNSITSLNTVGYMLQAGDEVPASTNNNLEGAIITGNRFTWNGTDMKSITHGLFTGHNRNMVIKYNYLERVPMGRIRKSGNNMSDTGGGVAYNRVKGGAVGINIKGIRYVWIDTNTLYSDRTTSETWRGLIYIYTNTDVTPNSVSNGTKVYNNLFYTKHKTYCIQIADAESAKGLESDYNVFYCESGTPMFYYCGSALTFEQWQALGYDTHSRVINPHFRDLVTFVPSVRLDYGKNLGEEWEEGLSVNARWGTTDPVKASQNGLWQVGAIIHEVPTTEPVNQPPLINISSPTKSTAFTAPATVTIDASVTDSDGTVAKVEFYNGSVKLGERTTAPWSFSWKDVGEGNYNITAAATDNDNARTLSDPVIVIVEKAAPAVNQLPTVELLAPGNKTVFEAPASLMLTVNASDPDGIIMKVEYYQGSVKLGESFAPPYNFNLICDSAGIFELTARAFDNLNGSAWSEAVTITVNLKKTNPDYITLFPNPNHGRFTIQLSPQEGEDEFTVYIMSMTGRTICSASANADESGKIIDISDSPGGNYLVMLSSHGKIISSKQFIKL